MSLVQKVKDLARTFAMHFLPIGSVVAYAGANDIAGFLLCDGAAISRTTYANLFAVLGTTHGAGDGITTFNLPNFLYRYIKGATGFTQLPAGVPNVTGNANFLYGPLTSNTPCLTRTNLQGNSIQPKQQSTSGTTYYLSAILNAKVQNAIYGRNKTVIPPSIEMRYLIKY